MTNPVIITVDVEDWFQVENFRPYISYSSWASRELRVEKNVHRLLDLFDSIALTNSNNLYPVESESHSTGTTNSEQETPNDTRRVKATFFILGWIAERLPGLVREIQSRGHEIASHGVSHTLAENMTPKAFEEDAGASKKILEDIIGGEVSGFRAPSFSINRDTLSAVERCGYLYDSSYNSFALHPRYGTMDVSAMEQKGEAFRISDSFYELPVSNMTLGKRVFPWGGGGYFRLMPFPVFMWGVKRLLKNRDGYIFYIHPWEIDPEQPRVGEASLFSKFKHYTGIRQNFSNLSKFLDYLRGSRFLTCRQYIQQLIAES